MSAWYLVEGVRWRMAPKTVAACLTSLLVAMLVGTSAGLASTLDPPDPCVPAFAGTTLESGRVLITGTMGGLYPQTALSALLYDPASGSLTTGGAMVTPRWGHSATLLADGRVLIVGGQSYDGGSTERAELYDERTGSFVETGARLIRRDGYTATLLADGRVLVAGGVGQGAERAELYDPASGTFSETGAMRGHRVGHTATLLADGRVLITGGRHRTLGPPLSSAELYDPDTGTFIPTGSMTMPRSDQSATLLADGRVLVAGGSARRVAEIYDPASGTFSPAASMGTPRSYQGAIRLADGRVLLVGGTGRGSFPSDCRMEVRSTELYDPEQDAFVATGAMARWGGVDVVAPLPDGRILVLFNKRWWPMDGAQLYDPVAGSFTPVGSFADG
jgi:hypothetical protein